MIIRGIEILGRAGEACPYCGFELFKTTWYGREPYDGITCPLCRLDFCPHCGSDEIQSGHVPGFPGEWVEVVECLDCGAWLFEERFSEDDDEDHWMVCELGHPDGQGKFCIGECLDPCPHVLVHGSGLCRNEAYELYDQLKEVE